MSQALNKKASWKVNEKKNVEKTTKIIEMRKREVNGEERMFEKSYIYS